MYLYYFGNQETRFTSYHYNIITEHEHSENAGLCQGPPVYTSNIANESNDIKSNKNFLDVDSDIDPH